MKSKNILLVVTGSVAAYKSLELLSLLNKSDYKVEILFTKSSLEFVTELSFVSLNARVIKDDLFDVKQEGEIGHINLTRKNDLVVIYPATANFIAKLAHGIADDLASTIILAANKKILVAPAMNVQMWHNKVTQDNISKLEMIKMDIIYPDKGKLACGEEGEGKVKSPQELFENIESYFSNKEKLLGKNILITAGGTIEKIDPVRFISNFSSGKQAIAIAKQLKLLGANITLIIANHSCHIPGNINVIKVMTAEQMYNAVIYEINKTPYDMAFLTAAVCDYRVDQVMNNKIKKSSNDTMSINLVKNPDILKSLCLHKNKPKIVVGFAAETENLIGNAKKKILEKKCDIIVANNVSHGKVFGEDNNDVTLIHKHTKQGSLINRPHSGSKDQVARFILSEILKSNIL